MSIGHTVITQLNSDGVYGRLKDAQFTLLPMNLTAFTERLPKAYPTSAMQRKHKNKFQLDE